MVPTSNTNQRFILLYGSQTGQAEAIAEEIRDQAGDYGFTADLHCLSGVDKKFILEKETVAVFVVSTTGDGEPPETALKFWKRLNKTSLPKGYLSQLRYSLLGLGDSNYNNFANFGKSLDKQLQRLGAVHFNASAFADDAVGLEVVVEPWITKLWDDLKIVFAAKSELDGPENLIIPVSNLEFKMTVEFKTKPVENVMDEPSKISEVANSSLNKTEFAELTGEKVDGVLNTDSYLRNEKLSLPPLPKPFLQVKISQEKCLYSNNHVISNCEFPSSVSDVKCVPIVSAVELTSDKALKKVLELTLDIADCNLSFEPGDSFGIICENDDDEVDALLQRLALQDESDVEAEIEILVDADSKKAVSVPSHLPPKCYSIRQILRTCCDIRAVPKKAFLRLLAEYATIPSEKRRLQELCSRQGAEEYTKYIREENLSFFDILMQFKSCKPPIARVLEHLPRLQARPYSVASSCLATPNHIRCVFTVVKIPKGNGRFCDKLGVCTGMLDKLTKSIQISAQNKDHLLNIDRLSLSESPQIHIFKRKSTGFHLPSDLHVPIIMIGAGAGIAPFIGFLEHRHKQTEQIGESSDISQWLLFGCRNKSQDFLYRDNITDYRQIGLLEKFSVMFSRENESDEKRRYVQHAIEQEADDFIHWITQKQSVVFVCGDAKNMAKDVCNQIKQCLVNTKNFTEEESSLFIQDMQSKKQYLQDIWT